MAKREKYGPDVDLASEDEMAMVMVGFEAEDEQPDSDEPFKPLSDDEIEGIVGQAVDDAVDFIESEISERRLKATRYFSGKVDIGEEEDRSTVVATKCRDVVRGVKPSIQRIFMSSDRPVEFIPQGPEDIASMEQASTYAAAKFRQSNGFQILRDVTHDALVNITGFTKAHWSEYEQAKVYNYADLDEAQYQAIIQSPDVQVLSETARTDDETVRMMQEQIDAAQQAAQQAAAMGQQIDPAQLPQMPDPLPQLYDLRILRRTPRGRMVIETIPPEDFFIDRNARSDQDYYVIGHRSEMRAADIIAMGIDEDDVLDLDSAKTVDVRDQEDEERRGYTINRDETENSADPAMRLVTVTEAYMRIDVDGTGVPLLHKFILGGSTNRLLAYEPVDDHPFASWHIDPEPHTFFGRSLVEIVEQDQDAATAVIRGILDNVQMTNNPRVEAVKGMVEIDDLLNNEIGAIIRVTQPNVIRDLAVPFVAGQTLPALQYIDNMVEVKTGVTRASMGLDPDALQSSTKAAVSATISAGAGQVEVMVANLAYTGMRRLFTQILKLMSQHSTRAEMLRINGSYVALDPRVWDSELDAEVNVGLGTANQEQKAAILGQVLQLQMQAVQAYGPDNPLAGLPQIRSTLGDLLALNGVANSDRYFMPTQPAQPPQAQPQGAGQPQQGDPSQALVQAETIKAQAKMASDSARLQLDLYKAQLADDRERDRMAQDMELAMAQIAGKYGIAVDTARIKAEQAATQPAMPMGAPAAPQGMPAAPRGGMPMPPNSGGMA